MICCCVATGSVRQLLGGILNPEAIHLIKYCRLISWCIVRRQNINVPYIPYKDGQHNTNMARGLSLMT